MTRMSPRVLVLGGSGLLGGHLLERLPSSFPTAAVPGRTGRVTTGDRIEWLAHPIDVDAAATIDAALDRARADVIVNAIGAEPRAASADLARVNARFPRALATLAARRGARVVQISSDAVFSGARGAYREDDRPDPVDAYGRSKLEGELNAPHLTLRTSVYGRSARGTGLIEWLIAQQGRCVDGFADYRFSGMAAPLLADFVAAAIDAGLEGVYHIGGDPVTKYELLSAAAARLRLGMTVRPAARGAVDRTLDSTRFFAAAGRRRPTLAESMEALTSCDVPSRA